MEEEKKGPFPHAYSLVAPLCLRIKLFEKKKPVRCKYLLKFSNTFKYDNLTFIECYYSCKKKS